ncbi:MAG: hypothetical protein M3406_15280 [Chloroflexota bacterium]|nr:hypothetical protein [Chloroflexota bacterium]
MGRDEQQTQADALPTKERVATLAGATADAIGHKVKGEHETEDGARQTTDAAEVARIIEQWPDAPKHGARGLIEHYGLPNEATPTKLFWYRNGPWKRTELTSDVVLHDFPSPHSDFLTQFIDYRVPVEMLSALGEYDGSCLVDRTAGEAAARCDSEAANLLTLNLMHEIITGKRTVADARETYAESLVGYTMGRDAPYCERFLFDVPQDGTADTDTPNAGAAMLGQTAGKLKDVITGHPEEATDRRT